MTVRILDLLPQYKRFATAPKTGYVKVTPTYSYTRLSRFRPAINGEARTQLDLVPQLPHPLRDTSPGARQAELYAYSSVKSQIESCPRHAKQELVAIYKRSTSIVRIPSFLRRVTR